METRYTDICAVDSRDEGKTLSELLSGHGINAEVLRHRDLAPAERQPPRRGWGSLRVASEDVTRAVELVQRWREGEPEAVQRRRERNRERHREAVRRSRKESREDRDYLEEREPRDRRRRRQRAAQYSLGDES